jgi:ATP-dependent helicase/nuclease subunit B
LQVWNTPQTHTWETWLIQQWRSAALHGRAQTGLQLLDPAQEGVLWEAALRELAGDDPESLQSHAPALKRAASLASQSLLALHRTATTEEEMLLVAALRQFRAICSARGLLSLNLASPEELDFLSGQPAPLLIGQPRLTPLQQRLQELYWPAEQLLLMSSAKQASSTQLCRAAHPEAEIIACARWCREHLQADGARRLLVVSCRQEAGGHTQGAQLWQAFAGGSTASEEQRRKLLAVEGGEPLHHQALVSDALAALCVTGEAVETRVLLQLLRSPYFTFGTASECAALQLRIGQWGLARWSFPALRRALASVSEALPVAGRLLAWSGEVHALLAQATCNATRWAETFSRCLQTAGFPAAGLLDSRDAQRLARWGQMLDEFAGLDAALPPMDAGNALQALRRLAQQAVHQVATGDAAITFTTQLHDPVVQYDGIWVLGLTESRWPPSPRPDPYVPLHEQRRCDWPQVGVTQRLAAAQWLQQRWQSCAGVLVLSYARLEGDVLHRPSPLAASGESWVDAATAASEMPLHLAAVSHDRTLPPMTPRELARPLRGGVTRLRVQQECPFHAQAQWRLRAEPPEPLTDGVPARLRGMLLHSLLEGIWGELQEQQQLLALTTAGQQDLFARQWEAALASNAAAGVAFLSPALLARERQRAERVVCRVLDLERERAPFAVQLREHELAWNSGAAQINMRIDRIDRTASGRLLVVDYKSGDAGAIRLHEGEARPLQLAAYVAAMAQQGAEVGAALLLSLKPARLEYAGVSGMEESFPGRLKTVADWPATQQAWQQELHALVAQHLAGIATLAVSTEACRYCHLPAFCRRRGAADAAEEEGADE